MSDAPPPVGPRTRSHSPSEPPPTKLVLLVVKGGRGERERSLARGSALERPKTTTWCLPDDTVSRHHCVLERRQDGIVLRDLGSTNHTKIGKTRVSEATVGVGTNFTVGEVDLVVQSEFERTRIMPSEASNFGAALGPSLVMRGIFGVLEQIAPSDAPVLLEGETGTGKDVLARSIHDKSARRDSPFRGGGLWCHQLQPNRK